MRIRIVLSGGVAGTRRARVVETTALPVEERATIERLVRVSGFFDRPAAGAAAAATQADAHRDARQIDLEIKDDAGRRHTVRMNDVSIDPAIQDLVDQAWAAGSDDRTAHGLG